jgi:hypothetical protein
MAPMACNLKKWLRNGGKYATTKMNTGEFLEDVFAQTARIIAFLLNRLWLTDKLNFRIMGS